MSKKNFRYERTPSAKKDKTVIFRVPEWLHERLWLASEMRNSGCISQTLRDILEIHFSEEYKQKRVKQKTA